MTTITISLADEKAKELEAQAQRLGVNVQELVRIAAENLAEQNHDRDLMPGDAEFKRAVAYVMKKNAELYRRLA